MDSHGNAAQYGEGLDLGLFVYCWVMGVFTKDEHGVSQAEYEWVQSGIMNTKGMTAETCNMLAADPREAEC